MTTETEDMRRQVRERVEKEKAEAPPAEEKPQVTSQLIRDCLFMNSLGDAILYATRFRDLFVYNKKTEKWFEWRGHYWQLDIMKNSYSAVEQIAEDYLGEYRIVSNEIADLVKTDPDNETGKKKLEDLQKALLKRVSQLRAPQRRGACIEFAHTMPNPLAIEGDEFDQHPMLYPCANGVIDLETGTLRPGRPRDYLSLASPIEFNINALAPLWEKIILEIQDGNEEMVAYLQRLFGYAMTGLVQEKVFPILYGRTGWNGRSLIVNAISKVMGKLAGTIQAEMLLSSRFIKSSSGPSPDIMSLKGRRAVFASETGEGHRFDTAKLKWFTGKDELKGRNPHDTYETEFFPTCKIFMMTNSKPSAPPTDKSFWERVHEIVFPLSFVMREPREDYERRAIKDLDIQLEKEYPGILAWLVKGCLEYQRIGLKPPKSVTDETEKHRRDEDFLADFIESCCVKEPKAKAQANELYKRFATWYHDNHGEKEPTPTWFGKQMGLRFDRTKSAGVNIYHGVRLPSGEGLV